MSSNMDGRFDFTVRVGVLQSPINVSGGEVRYLLELGDETGVLAEYYQPFGNLGRYFFFTRGHYRDYQINVFDDEGNMTAEYNTKAAGINLAVGREFGNYGALTLGARRYTGEADVRDRRPRLARLRFRDRRSKHRGHGGSAGQLLFSA